MFIGFSALESRDFELLIFLFFVDFEVIHFVEIRILIDIVLADIAVIAHKNGDTLVRHCRIVYRHSRERAFCRVHGGVPKLLGVHLAQALETLKKCVFAHLLLPFRKSRVVIAIQDLILLLQTIKGRHADIHVAFGDELAHIAEEERQKQSPDVRAVLVGVGKNNDFVVF